MGEAQAILRLSAKAPCFNEKSKTYLIRSNIFSPQRFTIFDETLSKPGLLLDFKLLNASFKSSS